MTTTREQFIETTCALLEAQGYHATGLNQIVEESGAPKGSLYYHFPGGKEELAVAAIERTSQQMAEHIQLGLSARADPAEAVRYLACTIADYIETSGFRAGGPLTMVAMETTTSSERINLACRVAFDGLLAVFRQKLVAAGYDEVRVDELAVFIVAAIEGGTLLSRTYHTGDPLRRVADELSKILV